jgi:hypothetical protein
MNFDGFWNPALPLKSNVSFSVWFKRERDQQETENNVFCMQEEQVTANISLLRTGTIPN